MSCKYYRGSCLFLNGRVYEDNCKGCPLKRAYNKGVKDMKKDYERPTSKWKKVGEEYYNWHNHITIKCLRCGYAKDIPWDKNTPHFCEDCGAKMGIKGRGLQMS